MRRPKQRREGRWWSGDNKLVSVFALLGAAGLLLVVLLTLTRARSSGQQKSSPGTIEAATSTARETGEIGLSPQPAMTGTPTASIAPAQEYRKAICVDGGRSGQPFVHINCIETFTTLSEAVSDVQSGGLFVVRAFPSSDPNSIVGMGTYRDLGLQNKTLVATVASPITIEAEGFNLDSNFARPIIDGGIRVTGRWEPAPGTTRTWQIPFPNWPGGFLHWACVDRIWVSRLPGKTELANFPLTRPLPTQGNDNPDTDCKQNTIAGQPITPADVDAFPGSYEWLDGNLYIHLPSGEDPNLYTVEVPYNHPFSAYTSASGLVIRGFRVYHTLNGIDLYGCGTSAADRCEASHNEASFNYPYGFQPGSYSYLHHNTGEFNTIQLIKVTGDNSEIAYNVVGPQLSQGLKLTGVSDCLVHNNQVYGNNPTVPEAAPQPGWTAIGTRDVWAGILIQNDTHGCMVYDNYLYGNVTGIVVLGESDANSLSGNVMMGNPVAISWHSDTWRHNASDDNTFDPMAVLKWGDAKGGLVEYQRATGLDANSKVATPSFAPAVTSAPTNTSLLAPPAVPHFPIDTGANLPVDAAIPAVASSQLVITYWPCATAPFSGAAHRNSLLVKGRLG
jgi:hypothetical protein